MPCKSCCSSSGTSSSSRVEASRIPAKEAWRDLSSIAIRRQSQVPPPSVSPIAPSSTVFTVDLGDVRVGISMVSKQLLYLLDPWISTPWVDSRCSHNLLIYVLVGFRQPCASVLCACCTTCRRALDALQLQNQKKRWPAPFHLMFNLLIPLLRKIELVKSYHTSFLTCEPPRDYCCQASVCTSCCTSEL